MAVPARNVRFHRCHCRSSPWPHFTSLPVLLFLVLLSLGAGYPTAAGTAAPGRSAQFSREHGDTQSRLRPSPSAPAPLPAPFRRGLPAQSASRRILVDANAVAVPPAAAAPAAAAPSPPPASISDAQVPPNSPPSIAPPSVPSDVTPGVSGSGGRELASASVGGGMFSDGSDGLTAGTIKAWQPQGKYLFAMCYYGRMSNQMDCMRRTVVAAALLNRTLVILDACVSVGHGMSSEFRWSDLIDLPRMRQCLAEGYGTNQTVLTVREMEEQQGAPMRLDAVACAAEHLCKSRDTTVLDWVMAHSNLTFPQFGIFGPKPHGLDLPMLEDFLRAGEEFRNTRVLSLNTLYKFGIRGLPFKLEIDQPFRSSCKDVLSPPPRVLNFVHGFINTFLGTNYGAVHMRRGDFASVYGTSSRRIYFPIVSVAEYVMATFNGTGVRVLFVASDGSPTELDLLKRLLLELDPRNPLVMVRLPFFTRESSEYHDFKWLQEFMSIDSHASGSLRMLAEKHICVHARYFVGTKVSSFTHDIKTLRRLEGTESPRDNYIGDEREEDKPDILQ